MFLNKKNLCSHLAFIVVIIGYSFFGFAYAFQATSTEKRSLASFSGIEVGGLVAVVLEPSDKEGVDIRVKGIALQDIVTRVENGVLLVSTTGSHRGESIDITVYYTDLNYVKTSGAATISNSTPIHSKGLSIEITENGDASLKIDTDSLNVNMQGNGNLTLRGRASEQSLISNGGGGSFDNSQLVR